MQSLSRLINRGQSGHMPGVGHPQLRCMYALLAFNERRVHSVHNSNQTKRQNRHAVSRRDHTWEREVDRCKGSRRNDHYTSFTSSGRKLTTRSIKRNATRRTTSSYTRTMRNRSYTRRALVRTRHKGRVCQRR